MDFGACSWCAQSLSRRTIFCNTACEENFRKTKRSPVSKIGYCAQCGKVFHLDYKDKMYCSRSCAAKINNSKHPKRKRGWMSPKELQKGRKPLPPPKPCLYCKKMTKPARQYCSKQCQEELPFFARLMVLT